MSDISEGSIAEAWARFLQDLELARHYPLYAFGTGVGVAPRNPLLDGLLVTFLFLRLVSLLDEGLCSYIAAEDLGAPRRNDLYHRIEFLAEKGRLGDRASLHGLREKRGAVAHESQPTSVDWSNLDEALNIVEKEFQQLGLVGFRPKYEFFAERSRARGSGDPNVAFALNNSAGLKENGEWIVRFSWTTNIHRGRS